MEHRQARTHENRRSSPNRARRSGFVASPTLYPVAHFGGEPVQVSEPGGRCVMDQDGLDP